MKKLITILEDDRDIREICTLLLIDEGYTVQSFANVASFSQQRTAPHLFLLDIQLPDGNGLDVCAKLRADIKYARIPIIMMSAHLQREKMMTHCLADDYIEKPFDINKLLQRVAKLIN